jgi:pimeloyl-ACP methyl ester carboxylesterase
MNTLRQHQIKCLSPAGFHRMAYVEWGDPKNSRVLVCVHGLTRCGRDFDFLAQALADDYRVVCPDVVGRGMSDWLRDPTCYAIPQYAADMAALIARLDVESVDWLGTSMGGMIGMALAAQPETPIGRLILNDVGPVIAAAALKRIGEYLATPPDFASIEDAESYIRVIAAPFGNLTDGQWRHLTERVVKVAPNGRIALRYDPGIAQSFVTAAAAMQGNGECQDIELWPLYDAIRCPTLVVRGENSDLLSRETVLAMQERGPRARAAEMPGVGHAPMFMDDGQVAVVREFLLSGWKQ